MARLQIDNDSSAFRVASTNSGIFDVSNDHSKPSKVEKTTSFTSVGKIQSNGLLSVISQNTDASFQNIGQSSCVKDQLKIPRLSRQSFNEWDLNPLAMPKGTILRCELCQDKKCRYQCPNCKSAFYCSSVHRDDDYNAIHKHICSRIEFVYRNNSIPNSNDERILATGRKEYVMKEIITIARDLAEESLFEGEPRKTLYQLRVAFKFSIELYGSNDINLIELHSLMSETYMRMGKFSKARQQLQKAEYILQEHEDECPNTALADFYKIEGLLNLSKLNFDDALISFANEVYFATNGYHTDHPRVATGLFHLGQTFVNLEKHETAYSHFMQTIDIWLKRFRGALREMIERMETKITITDLGKRVQKRSEHALSESEKNLSYYTIKFIQDYITEQEKSKVIPISKKANISCAFGVATFFIEDYHEAADLALKTKLYLRDFKDIRLTDIVQDLHRLARKELNQKDFKAASKQFKNLAKMKRKSLTLEEVLNGYFKTALKRKEEHENVKLPKVENTPCLKEATKKSIFGEDGYTIQEGTRCIKTTLVQKSKSFRI